MKMTSDLPRKECSDRWTAKIVKACKSHSPQCQGQRALDDLFDDRHLGPSESIYIFGAANPSTFSSRLKVDPLSRQRFHTHPLRIALLRFGFSGSAPQERI